MANYAIAQTALPVSYTGQTQDGNNSTSHLGAYDYLACAATSPNANGGVNLIMKHLGAFLRLQLTMPKADTYSSVVLESDGTKFITAGTFDLTAATPAIASTATSSSYVIKLNNVSTTSANEIITIYAMLAPADLSTSNIKVTIFGTSGTTYEKTVTGKNFEARNAYNIAVTSFTTEEDAHEYVDLGLSVKWAKMNIGATNIYDYGDYFAWGETSGYNSGKAEFSMDNYKYYKSTTTKDAEGFDVTTMGYTKYVRQSNASEYGYGGFYDNKTTLDLSDDAATVNWGGKWRMPTLSEWKELINNCTWVWATLNGINGCKVTATNGNYIFLPAAGFHISSGKAYSAGTLGRYWANSLYVSYSQCADELEFASGNPSCYYNYRGEYSQSIRPVLAE